MNEAFSANDYPHKRYNALTGEWVLVSPHRNKRPWKGKTETIPAAALPAHDPSCYLCPGSQRAEGAKNPDYTGTYVFTNDYPALLPDTPNEIRDDNKLFQSRNQRGVCRVICFSPQHNLTLAQLPVAEINCVIRLWQQEYSTLAANKWVRYIQIFENKGAIMGCSNPHPHGQIWAQDDCPVEIEKETLQQRYYFVKHNRSLLSTYLQEEIQKQERIVFESDHFVVLVPFWAAWPYETMIISRRTVQSVLQLNAAEINDLASVLKKLCIRYDNLFKTSFPYSAGLHQSPVNMGAHPEWHLHMHFYPPLLRSATVKKFMVGYEMLANPQKDITPEYAAAQLRQQSEVHYLQEK